MQPYCFQALPDATKWIRVLRLQPGTDECPLVASLQPMEISQGMPYEALSYCWGPKGEPEELIIREGGQNYLFYIGKSLYEALRQMRHPAEERVIWVDAVCINQDKKYPEKPHQILLMDCIYLNATRVLAYLGQPDEYLEKALSLIQSILRAARASPAYDQRRDVVWVEDAQLPSLAEPWKWEALKAFFRRPWFCRKWIIQECCLAKDVWFYCGEKICNWNDMSSVVATIYNKGLGVQDYTVSIDRESASQLESGLSQINAVRLFREGRQEGKISRFLDVVDRFQTSQATDALDHLYALISLASDSKDEPLRPDYERSMLQNCLHYARHFLKRDGTLEVIERAGLSRFKMEAPTWIPNWYGRRQNFGFEPTEGFWNPHLRPKHLHVARGKKVSMIDGSESESVIGFKGIVIDTIIDLGLTDFVEKENAWRDKRNIFVRRRQHLEDSDTIMKRLTTYPNCEPLGDVQWRTLMCNTTRAGERPDGTFRDAYEAWSRCLNLVPATDEQRKADFAASTRFNRVVDSWNASKIFGLTKEGYVGMFTECAKKGDKIAILYGGHFPFVLRPCTDLPGAKYELVGQCYVHGIMEGQLDIEQLQQKEEYIMLG